MASPLRIRSTAGRAFRKVIIWVSGSESTVATSPTITAGLAAPSGASAEPDGSLYLNAGATDADTALYVTISSTWVAISGT